MVLKLFLPHGPSKLCVNRFSYSHMGLSINPKPCSNSRAIHDSKSYGVLYPIVTLPLAETLSKHLSKMPQLWNQSVLLVRGMHSDGRNIMERAHSSVVSKSHGLRTWIEHFSMCLHVQFYSVNRTHQARGSIVFKVSDGYYPALEKRC